MRGFDGLKSKAGWAPKQRLYSALDIETWGLDAREDGSSFALGVVVDERGTFRFDGPRTMRDWLLSRANRGRVFYAHNGGRYDYYSIFGNYVRAFGRDCVMVGGRLIEFRARDDSAKAVIRFRDSLNLFPKALAEIGKAMGQPKGETPQKFIDADRSQGVSEEDYTYCIQDAQIVYHALSALVSEFGELRPTVPSLALSVFQRRYLPRDVYVRDRGLNVGFRQAYYGGRVEAYYLGKLKSQPHYYDINSLYPQAMVTTRFPNPSSLRVLGVTSLEQCEGLEGMAVGKVSIPHSINVPPLPYRRADGRLLFPVGQFEGAWTLLELRQAESMGADIQLREAIVSEPMDSPFNEYVTYMYKRKSETEGLQREFYKLMLNALYGKFGEYHRERTEYALHFDEKRFAELQEKWGDKAVWKPISMRRPDGYYSMPSENGGQAAHSIYPWAAYITAQARLINLRTQLRLMDEGIRVLYTDTDSFFTIGGLLTDKPAPADMIGDGLGQMKEEGKEITAIWGNKYYETTAGPVQKGIKKGATQNADGSYTYQGIMTAKEAIRRNLQAGSPKTITKYSRTDYDKRIVQPDGWTKPILLNNGI